MKRVLLSGTLMILFLLSTCTGVVHAAQPYKAYTYTNDAEPQAVPSVNAFEVGLIVDEKVMGCTKLKDPQDIFVDDQDRVFILDSGNCRVLILDKDYRCIKELTEFQYNGNALTLAKDAKGIFYKESDDRLYIADTQNNRIIVTDLNGKVETVYEKPVDELISAEVSYRPKKIIVDNMGIMYVVTETINNGALLIDRENNFLGFYGANEIEATWEVVAEYMWREILTESQTAQAGVAFLPTELNNIFWSDDRFVYAVSPSSDTVKNPVVKLNAISNNTFPSGAYFGDLIIGAEDNTVLFTDITVDNEGVFTILDAMSNKLYQYDTECNLLAVFGGKGSQKGLSTLPKAIESNSNNDILILDAGKNEIIVMAQTHYGKVIREAAVLHNDGLYEEAIESWQEVLKMNANYNMAYIGLGKGYMYLGEYKDAMECFKLGGDQEGYGEAKGEYRNQIIRENFTLISVLVIILMLVILFYDTLKKYVVRLFGVIKKGGNRR